MQRGPPHCWPSAPVARTMQHSDCAWPCLAQGVLAFWGLTEKQERDVIRNIVTPCLVDSLPQVNGQGRGAVGCWACWARWAASSLRVCAGRGVQPGPVGCSHCTTVAIGS